MKFRQTIHFQERFNERNLNFDHIKQAISNPDSREMTFNGKIKVVKNIGDKSILVIYSRQQEKSNEYLLITAYYI